MMVVMSVHAGAARLASLSSIEELDTAIRRSNERPVILFKHSSSCGTSAMALEEIEDLVAGEPAADIFIVSVQTAPHVSREIAARFGVRHESPQVLVIDRGAVRWHGSHFRVTAREIELNLRSRPS